MNPEGPKLLLVDDDPSVLEGLQIQFEDRYPLVLARNGEEAILRVREDSSIAVVLLDIKMPGMNGIETAHRIRQLRSDILDILHTAFPGEYTEDDISRDLSPYEYVEKASSPSRLRRAVDNAMQLAWERRQHFDAARNWADLGIVGNAEPVRAMLEKTRQVARQQSLVLILGETGAGKSLVARAIHALSSRRDNPFVRANCNLASDELIISYLFGHKKGSFTSADRDHRGKVAEAENGTLLIDEIGDLKPGVQGKLLDLLDDGIYEPIGHQGPPIKANVRILCATNRNLEELKDKELLRDDLYHRMNVIRIDVPPLRERPEDIHLLTRHFLTELANKNETIPKVLPASAMDPLLQYSWPGNVRELRHKIERIVSQTDASLITQEQVHRALHDGTPPDSGSIYGDGLAGRIHDFRRSCIADALRESRGNQREAARRLKIDPKSLRDWMKQYALSVEDFLPTE